MLLRSCSLMVSISSSISLFVFCLIVLSVVESGLFNSSNYCGLILINNNNKKNVLTFPCAGSALPCTGFLQLQ